MIEHYTYQLKNSDWGWKEAAEIVKSGFAGWVRKRRRREENGEDLYRGAAASLPARVRGKLTGRENWFKDKKRRKPDEFDSKVKEERNYKKRKIAEDDYKEEKTVGVLFVPYTTDGELAKRYREAEKELGRQTGIKLKIVEKTGSKLVDLLHRSDP